MFSLKADFLPAGDQQQAVDSLLKGLASGHKYQTLEGVTGSGKTFTMANVIQKIGKPTLVISHNKTLAAQLYTEFKNFFPGNAVEYFVSYYDYYQPEAYIPQTDTYIEKDSSINSEIERLRLSATNSLLSRDDVVIVASVSCIYGLGSPEDYIGMLVSVEEGQEIERDELLRRLVDIQYSRNDYEIKPGVFRVRGDSVDIYLSYSNKGVRLDFFGDTIEAVKQIDNVSGKVEGRMKKAVISPAKHFVMPESKIAPAIERVKAELEERVRWFEQNNKLLEAQRIRQRTMYDMAMLKEIGFCSGIENYSRHLSGRGEGEPPATLLKYFQGDFLTIIDESHVTLPQIRGMYNGDQARKSVLIEHGFRLPSAKDNRPMNFEEFVSQTRQIICATATPGPYELQMSQNIVKQVIRPTYLIDPPVTVRPLKSQIDDLMGEIKAHAARNERVLVTTLTKKTAEDLSEYLREAGIKTEYLHSDIDAVERVEILNRLRKQDFDCLIGINLLREGLDLPEVTLVAILDADKEGFLRSNTALIQVAGRAARNIHGKVILYADNITDSMKKMMDTTEERRSRQIEYNAKYGMTPVSISKPISDGLSVSQSGYGENDLENRIVKESGASYDIYQAISELQKEMLEAADAMEFERAASLRDEMLELQRMTKTDK